MWAYVMPSWTGWIALAFLGGAVISVPAAIAAGTLRRFPMWIDLALAGLVVLGSLYAVLFAGSVDRYFSPEERTYWQWGGASRLPLVVALAIALVAVAAVLLTRCTPNGRRRRPSALILCAMANLALLVGVVAIGTGH